MEERLQKIIARAGIASRRAAEAMIVEGRVLVDGKVVKELGAKADPERSEIRVDGVRVRPDRPRRYLVLNKPRGYVTTRSDPGHRPTVMELLPVALRTSVYPVGRLDMESSGLLLVTDDGDFAERVAHPRYGVPKTYRVLVHGVPDDETLRRARRGLRVEGDRLRLASVKAFSPSRRAAAGSKSSASAGKEKTWLRATLSEGKNREVRRLFKALGHPVVELHREAVGPVTDRGLEFGAYRALTPAEIRALLAGPSAPERRRTRRGH